MSKSIYIISIYPHIKGQKAVKKSESNKRVGCHTFGHCFATHLLEQGVNIQIVKELMGHADVKTTEIYTHVTEKNTDNLHSSLDQL